MTYSPKVANLDEVRRMFQQDVEQYRAEQQKKVRGTSPATVHPKDPEELHCNASPSAFLQSSSTSEPTVDSIEKGFKFIDLFAGIGGFHIAMHSVGGKCVFASEIDGFARAAYELNYKKWSPELFENGLFNRDITELKSVGDFEVIPDFDVLCAGFPCQPFSQAGLKKGFDDLRGTLFFNIAKIVDFKKNVQGRPPRVLLLENVKGLKGHDRGNTLKTILDALDRLEYDVSFEVLNSKNFGIPQNRERLFIVASLKASAKQFRFPLGVDEAGAAIFEKEGLTSVKKTRVGDILLEMVDEKYTISKQLFEGHLRRLEMHRRKGNGFGFVRFTSESPYTSTISARYYKDGSEIMIEQEGKNPRKLHPIEAAKLQGFPIGTDFEIFVSDTQAYKQFGNSVSVPVVKSIAEQIVIQLLS